MEWLDVTCNKCKWKRFQVPELKTELPKDHIYFSCPDCVYKGNMERAERNRQMPASIRYDAEKMERLFPKEEER
jgi:hypothetical protein